MIKKLLLILLSTTPITANAIEIEKSAWGRFDHDFEEKPWMELQAQLPPTPRTENLLPFFVSATTDNRFFVDALSISPGEDGVVRYTLVIQSSSGASNISYEGMRCSPAVIKRYAFGRSDGGWGKSFNAKWEQISYKSANRHHHMLHDDFFCPRGIIIRSAEEAVSALKRGEHPGAGGIAW